MTDEMIVEAKRIIDDELDKGCHCAIWSNMLHVQKTDGRSWEDNKYEWNEVLKEVFKDDSYFITKLGGDEFAVSIERKRDYVDYMVNHKLKLVYHTSFFCRPYEDRFSETITIGDNYISYKKTWADPSEDRDIYTQSPKFNTYCKVDNKQLDKNEIMFKLLDAFMRIQIVDVCDGDDLALHCYYQGSPARFFLIPCANAETMDAIKEALAPYLECMPRPNFLNHDECEE